MFSGRAVAVWIFARLASLRNPGAKGANDGMPPSIRVEHPLDFLRVAGLRQCEHQQNARLLRIERIRDDEIEVVVLRFAVPGDDPVADAARAHDDDALLPGFDERWLHGGPREAPVSNAGVDDAF